LAEVWDVFLPLSNQTPLHSVFFNR
jgi:hypothetical protein